jgi:mRNA interferase RelE/StbE
MCRPAQGHGIMVGRTVRELKISRQADRFILSLNDKERQAVKDAIGRLVSGDTQGLDIVRLLPHPKEYRLRVGRVRVLFQASEARLFIFKAEYRGAVYRR